MDLTLGSREESEVLVTVTDSAANMTSDDNEEGCDCCE